MRAKKNQAWKFLVDGMMSQHGGHKWKIGKWYEVESVEMCVSGFHASRRVADALGYVYGSVLCLVEFDGECVEADDKLCAKRMRVIRAFKWCAVDNVRLAIYAASSVLDVFEKKFPDDMRPRLAIRSARRFVAGIAAADAASVAANAAEKIDLWCLRHVNNLKEIFK